LGQVISSVLREKTTNGSERGPAGVTDFLAALVATIGIFGPLSRRKTAKLVRRPPNV
jgi:hypothetical protein